MSGFHPPSALHKHQGNLMGPSEVRVLANRLGHHRLGVTQHCGPTPAAKSHPHPHSCHRIPRGSGGWGGVLPLFLSVISKTSETKQKCTPTRRSTVRLSPDFPPEINWKLIGASFSPLPPPLLSGFPAACRSTGCPYGSTPRCSKSSREGEKSEGIFKYNNTYASCHGMSRSLLHGSGWKIRSRMDV